MSSTTLVSPISRSEFGGATVDLRQVVKSFGDVRAVDDVSIQIDAGEFLALLGPSGSGKTTLFMTIAGFEQPDSGEIKVGSRVVTHDPAYRRGLGIVFQRYALFPHLTVAENVAYPLRVRGMRRGNRHKEVMRALELLEMAAFGQRQIHELSGGQQQRVALARALVFSAGRPSHG